MVQLSRVFHMSSMVLNTLLLWVGLTVVVDTQEIPDGCTQVRMREEAVCEDKEVEQCGMCQTIHTRNCNIIMRDVWVPLRHMRCNKNMMQSVRCVEGARRSCTVRLDISIRSTCHYSNS